MLSLAGRRLDRSHRVSVNRTRSKPISRMSALAQLELTNTETRLTRTHLYEKQLWSCDKCGCVRVWGWKFPEDKWFKPLLNCEGCERPTRHGFVGIAGVTI